jgi:hypothetical protein
MPAQDDREYFIRRARQERAIASTCEDNAVALAHLRMADTYECRARELEHEAREMPATLQVRGVALQ